MNIGLFKNNEITGSVEGVSQAKMHSPLYGVFILSWVATHWQPMYVAFFVSEDQIFQKYGMLRNEYISDRFLNFHHLTFYVNWAVPVIVTVLVIWVVPDLIGLRAFRAEEKYKNAKIKVALQEATQIEAEEKKLESASAARLEASTKRAGEQRKLEAVDPTVGWEEEFGNFSKSRHYREFQYIVDAVYKYRGRIEAEYNQYGKYEFQVPQSILVFADTTGLIEIDTSKANTYITLTKKGRFFVSKFSANS